MAKQWAPGNARWINIQDGVIASLISGTAVFAASLLSPRMGKTASEAAGLLLLLYVLVFASYWKFRRRMRRAIIKTARPTGDRLSVYVARFEGDTVSERLQERIEETIRKDFGGTVEVLWTTLSPPPPESRNSQEQAAAIAVEARAKLAQNSADILIWAKEIGIGAGACQVHLVSADEEREWEGAFQRRGNLLLLDSEFNAELGGALAGVALVRADAAEESLNGDNVVEALSASARQFDVLIQAMPVCIRPLDRGLLLQACGLIQHVIGIQSGDRAPLDAAAGLINAALLVLTPDSYPMEWAKSNYHLARVLCTVARIYLSGTEELEAGVVAVRLALAHPEFAELSGFGARAYCLLAQIFIEVGHRTASVETLRQGIAAADQSLERADIESDPGLWVVANAELAQGWCWVGRLKKDAAAFEHAIAAYQRSLLKAEGRVRLGTLSGLARAHFALAEIKKETEAMRLAVEEHRTLLGELKPFILHWVTGQTNFACMLLDLSALEERELNLKAAVAAFELAFNLGLTQVPEWEAWTRTRFNYAIALTNLGEFQQDTFAFERAAAALGHVVEVWTSGPQNDKATTLLKEVLRRLNDRRWATMHYDHKTGK